MTRRFWIGFVLTLPLVWLAMSGGGTFTQVLLATPVVLYCGWPFFVLGWSSIRHRALNMFTLIAMGTGVAYLYSVLVTIAPSLLPVALGDHGGSPGVYFETSAAIVVLVLF